MGCHMQIFCWYFIKFKWVTKNLRFAIKRHGPIPVHGSLSRDARVLKLALYIQYTKQGLISVHSREFWEYPMPLRKFYKLDALGLLLRPFWWYFGHYSTAFVTNWQLVATNTPFLALITGLEWYQVACRLVPITIKSPLPITKLLNWYKITWNAPKVCTQ